MMNEAQPPENNRRAHGPGQFSLRRELVGILCLLAALGLFCGLSLRVLTPKRQQYGSVWGMFAREPADSLDVLVMGSSLAYCDVVPAVLYEDTGLTSFVMAGPQQTMPITYYYLREALKTQHPQVVALELTGMFFAPDNRHVKTNLTFMPYDFNRWAASFSETRGEELLGLMFPLYAYHDRWDKLTRQDLTEGLWGQQADVLAGYTYLDQVTPAGAPSYRDDLDQDPAHYARAAEYLEKLRDLCREENIVLRCFLSPAAETIPPELLEQLEGTVERLGLSTVNYSARMEDLALDWETDFFDLRHLNYRGAEKFTRLLGEDLTGEGLAPGKASDADLWSRRVAEFSRRKADSDAAPLKLKQSPEGGEGQ